jgi:hypothetical protein
MRKGVVEGGRERISSRSESDNHSIRIQGFWDSRVQARRKNLRKELLI